MSLFGKPDKKSKSSEKHAAEEKKNDTPNVPSQLPVIALKNTLIYPYTVVPVFFEDGPSLAALEEAQKQSKMIAAFTLNDKARKRLEEKEEAESASSMEDDEEEGNAGEVVGAAEEESKITKEDLYSVGTVCLIHRVMPVAGRKGAMGVLQGVAKVKAIDMWRDKPFMTAVVEPVVEKTKETKEIKALMRNSLSTAQKIIQNTPYLPQELQMALEDLSDPLKFVYLLATLVRFDVSEKQMILEEDVLEEKLKKTAAILSRELEQIELGGKIVSNVKKEFNRMSREAFLRQQLKEIQRELGEETETQQEANAYRKKLGEARLPEDVERDVEREIDRLESMHPHSSEYQVVRTYLDWIFDIPWQIKHSKKKIKLKDVEKVLEDDHYGLEEVKKRITEYIAVQQLNKAHKGPILCFVGPPGVGKTSLGKSIARALGKEFVRVSLGGVKDEAEIRGHRRTYVGALPGRIIQGIRRAGTMDPVFMLDEIDKVGNDFRGDPSSALLEVLDPEQNSAFNDHYLDLNYDLSNVLFIATANVLDTIQPALRDRMEVIQISGYIDEEKKEIAKRFLWPRVLERHGLKSKQIKMDDSIFRMIIDDYTREAGVRNLEKELSKLARKVAYMVVSGKQKSITMNKKKVRDFLGPQRTYLEVAGRTARPGVATGLVYTSVGGEILFIEATHMPGNGKFALTGSLGDVMKESAKTALSLVRARSDQFGIKPDFFKKHDIHLHVPAGATPKDGPSAGITMATAVVSLITNKKIRPEVAMTGEVTLTGQVLPIGGLKEKLLAAKRAGIKTVIIPKKNEPDVSDIKPNLLKGLTFKYVETIDEVFEVALI